MSGALRRQTALAAVGLSLAATGLLGPFIAYALLAPPTAPAPLHPQPHPTAQFAPTPALVPSPAPAAALLGGRPSAKPASRSRPLTPPERGGTGSRLDWTALARCESGGDPTAVSRSGRYRGAFQFDLRTWATYGPPGDPAAAPYAEQLRRAHLLYTARGRAPWPHCGRLL